MKGTVAILLLTLSACAHVFGGPARSYQTGEDELATMYGHILAHLTSASSLELRIDPRLLYIAADTRTLRNADDAERAIRNSAQMHDLSLTSMEKDRACPGQLQPPDPDRATVIPRVGCPDNPFQSAMLSMPRSHRKGLAVRVTVHTSYPHGSTAYTADYIITRTGSGYRIVDVIRLVQMD